LNEGIKAGSANGRAILTVALAHCAFKTFSMTIFMLAFFGGYLYLLKRPATHVSTIPVTWLDHLIGFQPAALPVYLSLWLYVSLPLALMAARAEVIAYGIRIAALCLVGLGIFYFWPNAITPANIAWENYPGIAFLKSVDMAGNAFPSLHVATAVFSALWLHWRIKRLQLGPTLQFINAFWCVAIAYSTLAIKQHVALDVYAGTALGVVTAWATALKNQAYRVPYSDL